MKLQFDANQEYQEKAGKLLSLKELHEETVKKAKNEAN